MSRVVLLSGAAGFLGSNIAEALLESGDFVVGIDNLATGNLGNISHLKRKYPTQFVFLEEDVRDSLVHLEYDYDFNLVLNFACPASPPAYQSDSLFTLDTCYLGTRNMLEVALKCGAKFVQASTSEIYGDPEVSPQREDYRGSVNTMGIRSCYDEGKRIGETLAFEYRRVHALDTKVIRIFNTYGPRMDPEDGRVVSNFVAQALRGEALTIYGDGSQTRSFCFVDDLVRGILAVAETTFDFTGPVNLGNPVEFTMLELATVVGLAVGETGITYRPLPSDDPRQRRPDIALAREALGWEPSVPLREGVEILAEAFRAQGVGRRVAA